MLLTVLLQFNWAPAEGALRSNQGLFVCVCVACQTLFNGRHNTKWSSAATTEVRVCLCVCVLARGATPPSRCSLWLIINDLDAPPVGCGLAGSVALHPLLGLSRLHHPWQQTSQLKTQQEALLWRRSRTVTSLPVCLTFTEIQEELLDAFIQLGWCVVVFGSHRLWVTMTTHRNCYHHHHHCISIIIITITITSQLPPLKHVSLFPSRFYFLQTRNRLSQLWSQSACVRACTHNSPTIHKQMSLPNIFLSSFTQFFTFKHKQM